MRKKINDWVHVEPIIGLSGMLRFLFGNDDVLKYTWTLIQTSCMRIQFHEWVIDNMTSYTQSLHPQCGFHTPQWITRNWDRLLGEHLHFSD